jgi:molybdenum cofactor cytidylyltransferase
MGSIKQLLPYQGRTLLTHAIAEAQDAGFHRVAVVLGAYADQIEPVIRATGAEIVLNPDWETGMGSSIRAGLAHLLQGSDALEILGITLADQPYVKAAHLKAMRELLIESGAPVVAAQYASQYGVPALFRKEAFPLLLALPPQAGARQALRNHRLPVTGFPLPEAEVDVDTPADVAELHKVRP